MDLNLGDKPIIPKWVDYAWLGLGDIDKIKRNNPLHRCVSLDMMQSGLNIVRLMKDPNYLSFTTKVLLDIQLLPEQAIILEELWKRPFPMFVGTRGFGKSWILAVYATLKCILSSGIKIVIVGAGFRQAKVIFEYMETIWKNAPILRSLCDNDSGPRRDVDRCTVKINNSVAYAIPMGDGNKIRGLRANIIISDEFAAISPDIYETVVAGFAAVSSDPVMNVKEAARRKELSKLGIWTADAEYKYGQRQRNQAIISGTADYGFKSFAKYWQRYHDIIQSKGNLNKLREILNTDDVPSGFDWKDYSIIRVPYELVPEGFMDDKQIIRAKATMHAGIYNLEYGACASFDTDIITSEGVKKIIDIELGDLVLTHKGRFKKVLRKFCRPYNSNIIQYKTYGCNISNLFTPHHQFYGVNNNFVPLYDIIDNMYLSNLKELSNLQFINLKDICSDYVYRNQYIYCKGSRGKLSNDDINDILDQLAKGIKQTIIAKKYNVHQVSISSIGLCQRPKASLNNIIKLDYNFGLCVGYYASEGSCSKRMVAFALDAHVNTKFTSYIKELCDAIKLSFGIIPKQYNRKDNTVQIQINSRLARQVFKYICPGISHTKLIKHDILFSNEYFLKGFIVGIFNGDGHLRDNLAMLQLANINLVMQVKLILSYFNIGCSINKLNRSDKRRDTYVLTMFGKNLIKFYQIFYNKTISTNGKHFYINNIQDKSIFKIKTKELIPYKGLVYNLEVEEDNSYSTLNATVHNCFISDSEGFFKRSMIESCVGTPTKPILLPSGEVWFDISLHGSNDKQYIIGIDPASEADNFSIIVLEVHADHNRIVYGWSTNRQDFKRRLKVGLANKDDFYGFCARKIRDLMKVFPTVALAMDSQGGGVAVEEALHDSDKMEPGELPIWPVIDDDKEKDTDIKPGLHILHLCQFAKRDWTAEANHGMRKDFEDKVLLFPRFDSITLGLSSENDNMRKKLFEDANPGKVYNIYDTLEDCVAEIEELKNELSTIVMTQTGTDVGARDRWDTPEVKLPNGKKGKLRKDRYSALVMANMVARQYKRADIPAEYKMVGDFANNLILTPVQGKPYSGPDWFVRGMEEILDFNR